MSIELNNTSPMYIQLAECIRRDIINGKYKPDEQIPTVRQLSFEYSVNPNTVQRALGTLEAEGLIVVRSTSGRFVTHDCCICDESRKNIIREFISSTVKKAGELQISKQDLINYITESEVD